MPTRQTVLDLTAIITTLSDLNEPAPESALYLALDADIARFQKIKTLLISAGLATSTNHALTLTPAGQAKAVALRAILKTHNVL